MKRIITFLFLFTIFACPVFGEPVDRDSNGVVKDPPVPVQKSFDITGDKIESVPYEKLTLYKISGIVLEKGSKAPLKNSRIFVRDMNTQKIVQTPTTDGKGCFVFELVKGSYQLIIAQSGYDKFEHHLTVPGENQDNLVLRLTPQMLNPYHVIVRQKKENSEISSKTLSSEEAASVPGSGRDVLKSVTSLPGVNNVSVFNGYGKGIVIRGSSQEDSLFMLDDHTIPSYYHFGGFESIVEPELVDSITYNAGGFSSEYGNAMGGVIGMNLRNPRTDRFGGYVNISMLSSSFLVEGPVSDKDSVSFGMKRGFIDQYIKLAEKVDKNRNTDNAIDFIQYPVYYDASLMINHRISEGNELKLIGIGSDDSFEFINPKSSISERFSNTLDHSQKFGTLIGEWHYKNGPFQSVLSPMFTSSSLKWNLGDRAYHIQDVDQFSLSEKLEYRLNGTHTVKTGIRLDSARVNLNSDSMVSPKEGEISYDHTDLELKIDKAFSFFYPTFYIMDQITLGKFTVTPGIHTFRDTYNHHDLIDPRLFIRYQLNKTTALKAAGGLYSQMPQYDEFLEPWGTKGLKPERSIHKVAGIEHNFTDSIFLDVQAYHKSFTDLVVRESEDNPTHYTNSGTGESYGAEILLRQSMTDHVFGWISYSYSVAKRKDSPDKPERYFDMDIPHNLVAVLNYKPNRNWSFGVRYQYVSGTPYTDLLNVNTSYDVDNNVYVPQYTGDINTQRLPAHQQLDFRVDRYWIFDKFILSTYVDFRNVFRSSYVTSVEYNEDYTSKEPVKSVDSQIPLIFFGMKIDF